MIYYRKVRTQHSYAYVELIFLPDSQKNVNKRQDDYCGGFEKIEKADGKTSDWAAEATSSDTPFKWTVEDFMEWQWFEGGQAN